jgi:glycosyltransferase involved in cell wall biosynthesis
LRVLTLLCQKICATGSGVVVKETIDRSEVSGVDYAVLSAGYADDDPRRLLRNPPECVEQVVFQSPPPEGIPMPIAGMSNRMPYPSKAFKDLTLSELEMYVAVWSRRIRRLVDSFRPDLIHAHHLWLLAAIAARTAPALPIVVSIHGTDLLRAHDAPAVKLLVDPWVTHFNRLIGLTADSVALARRLYDGIDERRFTVLGNGFNDELFRPGREGSAEALARYGIEPDGRHIVLFVGKYERWKGIEWLIRAFAQLRRERTLLVIAGGGPEEEGGRYRNLAQSLGVGDDVVLPGAIRYEDVGLLMNAAPLFVLPSINEPYGLALLEAIACGCRVVSTDQGGPPRFVPRQLREREDALLVPGLPSAEPEPVDAERFVESLASAIERQLVRAPRMNERQETASSVSHLTWSAYVSRLGSLYREIS